MQQIEVKKRMMDVEIISVFCDRCGNSIKNNTGNAFNSTIELQVGEYNYYDGSFSGENHRVDLCEECAKFVFFNLFPSNNINVINEDDEHQL